MILKQRKNLLYFFLLNLNSLNYSENYINLSNGKNIILNNKILTGTFTGIGLIAFIFYKKKQIKKNPLENISLQPILIEEKNKKITKEEIEKKEEDLLEKKSKIIMELNEIHKSQLLNQKEINKNKLLDKKYNEYEKFLQIKERFLNDYNKLLVNLENSSKEIEEEDLMQEAIDLISKEDLFYIKKIYDFVNAQFYINTLNKINSNNLSKKSQDILQEIKNKRNFFLYDKKVLFELLHENICEIDINHLINLERTNKEEIFINIENFIKEINNQLNIDKKIKSLYKYINTEDGKKKHEGFLIQNINLENLFKDFRYLPLKEYELDNSGNKNNCYFFSLMHMITLHIFKIKEDNNLSKNQKEELLGKLLGEYETICEALKEFLKNTHTNFYKNKIQDEIRKEFAIHMENFFTNKSKDNKKITINLLENGNFSINDSSKISEILNRFFYFYMSFARGAFYKNSDFAQDFKFIDTEHLGEFLWDNVRRLNILNSIYSIDKKGIISSWDRNLCETDKHNRKFYQLKSKIFNPLLFEQYNSNDTHFTCKILMTTEEYLKYKEFLKNLQKEIDKFNINQFEEIIPYNFINRGFLVPLNLTGEIS